MQNILLIILVLVVITLVFILLRRKPASSDDTALKLLLEQMNELSRTVDRKMGETNREMGESMKTQFSESQRLATDIRDLVHKQLNEVAKEVAETKESTKQVFTIADQLQNLEKVLKNQKLRGNLGEASLELVLSNMLSPEMYSVQYQFKNGDRVDAIINTKEGIIPVDAKFPLENYTRLIDESDDVLRERYKEEFRKDLKKRIDESAKYIRTDENTLPFAFMFIPAEAIYYDLTTGDARSGVNSRSLIDYAYNEKSVIIVSPTTFAAYLKSVVYGFKAFKIEKDAESIKKNVEVLMNHLIKYESYYKSIGKALGTASNQYELGYKELNKIDKDILKITGKTMNLEIDLIDKPDINEV